MWNTELHDFWQSSILKFARRVYSAYSYLMSVSVYEVANESVQHSSLSCSYAPQHGCVSRVDEDQSHSKPSRS